MHPYFVDRYYKCGESRLNAIDDGIEIARPLIDFIDAGGRDSNPHGPLGGFRQNSRRKTCSPAMGILPGQLFEERVGVFQIGGIEALREPVVDFAQHRARFVATTLVREQSREAGRGAQFK